MRAVLFGCALTLVPLAGTSQTPPDTTPSEQPTFRTGVKVIRVDVTVTGKDHQPVDDLSAEDFEVREDGVLQKIDSFQFVRLTGAPAQDDDTSLRIRSPEHAEQEAAREDVRLLVIFIDDYHLRFGPLFDVQLRRMLRRFMMEEMRATDLFAVMGPLTPLTHLQLTRDKQALLREIDGVQGRLGGFVPPRSALEENQFGLSGPAIGRIRAQITLSALRSLSVYLGGLREGRASVLFVSEGPPLQADRSSLFDDLDDVVAAANASNVTIHTLDPRELGATGLQNAANQVLASETGGRALAQSNDFTRGLKAIMADASAYYLLGYARNPDIDDGKFHKIRVRVRRKGLRVLARKGYRALAPENAQTQPASPTTAPELAAALQGFAIATRPHVVTDWVSVGPVENGASTVTVVSEASPEPASGDAASVVVQVVGHDGVPKATYPSERADDERVWVSRFAITPGTHTVRVHVYDSSNETVDSWTREIHVPAGDDATAGVGTPMVFRPQTIRAYRALLNGAELLPAAHREFRRTDRVVVRLPVVRGTSADVRAELVNARGQTLMTLLVSPSRSDGSPQVELPLASLARAPYVLRLTAFLAGGTASRLVPFAVVP